MKKILVTGSSGFIGRHLVSALRSRQYEVIEADRVKGVDLADPEIVQRLPDVDTVIHLAAFNGTRHFYERPLDVIRDNVLPTQYLLDRYAGSVDLFAFTGTCESYAGMTDHYGWPIPTPESVPLVVTDVQNPRWSYGGSKILNELQCAAAHSQLGQDYVILRYHNVYGPGQRDHFIQEFWQRALQGELSLYGWNNTRSWMYITDAIEATLAVIGTPSCRNEIINIGTDQEYTIQDMAKMIMEAADIQGELTLHDAPTGSVKRRSGDTTKLRTLTGFEPKIDIRQGIQLTVDSLPQSKEQQ
jgi:UDP-glucose 4-epimerase